MTTYTNDQESGIWVVTMGDWRSVTSKKPYTLKAIRDTYLGVVRGQVGEEQWLTNLEISADGQRVSFIVHTPTEGGETEVNHYEATFSLSTHAGAS